MNNLVKKILLSSALIFFLNVHFASAAGDAILYVTPSEGTFSVGETFTVSIILDSSDNFINATKARLSFPPDKLQVVSPSVGKSFIDIWVGQPKYSNSKGTLEFQGAVPSPGIKVSSGLISTVTFRVNRTGKAEINFFDDSAVLLNDGSGTDILGKKRGAVFDLTLPPPQGPIVSSETHPDQASWYAQDTVVLEWNLDPNIDAYSFVLDNEPLTIPDNIPDGSVNNTSYKQVKSGNNYFHVKALKDNVWGATSHFALNVDVAPPAEFIIEMEPSARTSSRNPIVKFVTTDSASGLSHYEIKFLNLDLPTEPGAPDNFFIEVESPYVPELLGLGKYDVIVRAYDNAGNIRESVLRAHILTGAGIFTSYLSSPPTWLWLLVGLTLVILILLLLLIKYWRRNLELVRMRNGESSKKVKGKTEVVHKLSGKYLKHKAAAFLLFSIICSTFLLNPDPISAAKEPKDVLINPPIILSVPENISNTENLYVSGQHPTPDVTISIFAQNVSTGITNRFSSKVDSRGGWFYSDNAPLPVGTYDVWATASIGERDSPPSARYQLQVDSVVIDLGFSRFNAEFVYGILMIILFVICLILAVYTYRQFKITKEHHILVKKEIGDIEEALNRGFTNLHKEIEIEIEKINLLRKSRHLREEELEEERRLLNDLDVVRMHIKEELADLKLIS